MALDTREKRQSAASISMYWAGANPTPTAAKDQEWRQSAAWGYPGILAGGAPPAPTLRTLAMMGIGL
jgi:hypothetical protein